MRLAFKQLISIFLGIGISLILVACKTHPPQQPTAGTDILNTLQGSIYTDKALNARDAKGRMAAAGVGNALLPPLSVREASDMSTEQHRFNVSAKDVPAGAFFMSLVSGTNYNMLIDPNITGTISLRLKNVTIEETLNAVRELYGYEYQRTSTGYEIIPPLMKTQIFTVDYLDIQRTGKSRTELVPTQITNGTTSGGSTSNGQPNSADTTQTATPGSEVVTDSHYNFWKELADNLNILIGTKDGRWVVVNPQASTVMIHAYPKELHEAADYLDHLQKNLRRQVIIEAKVLEIILNDEYKAGIDWKALGLVQNGSNAAYNPIAEGGFVTLTGTGDHGDFTTFIQLLQTQGNVQTLSSPHVSTVNNQEAVIKVGEDQFFVTGYTSNVTPTGSTNTTSQSVALTPFFSGITLDVTPQISSNGELVLYIHPAVSTVTDQTKTISLGGTNNVLSLPLAKSTIRETDSVVHAKSGQIIVLGGLMQHTTSETISATPGLTKIPFAGAAARDTDQTSIKSELIILLKPIVVGGTTWPTRLQHSTDRMRRLKHGFHFGGMPEVFGDEAEAHP